jgi:hypothetical protein
MLVLKILSYIITDAVKERACAEGRDWQQLLALLFKEDGLIN